MKKKTKKKVSKKGRLVAGKVKSTELVIKVQSMPNVPITSDLAEPIRDGKSLTIPKTWLSEKQITRLVEKTPAQYVYKRPGKGGGTWDYVTVAYVQRVLDFAFGFNWDFEIVQHGKEADHVWVLGKLTVYSENGERKIVKSQFGRSEVKHKQGGKELLDYGNDLKAATSDALKKCASMLGIARDIYGKSDYKSETGKEVQDRLPVVQQGQAVPQGPKDGQVKGPDGDFVYVSSQSGEIINEDEYKYSMKMYGRALSRAEQVNAKKK